MPPKDFLHVQTKAKQRKEVKKNERKIANKNEKERENEE